MKMSSDECHRQQAITWPNVDPFPCRQMASLGRKKNSNTLIYPTYTSGMSAPTIQVPIALVFHLNPTTDPHFYSHCLVEIGFPQIV